ncbi:hypothetical protein [Bacteriophage sp.]|nr:hypothetical protein [Bacteriophage sp.]UOF80131.1 hypothetical protein [Bacteriophage sp.]
MPESRPGLSGPRPVGYVVGSWGAVDMLSTRLVGVLLCHHSLLPGLVQRLGMAVSSGLTEPPLLESVVVTLDYAEPF